MHILIVTILLQLCSLYLLYTEQMLKVGNKLLKKYFEV